MKEEIWNELYLYLRIEIGVFKNFKECARSPCNGNHFSSTNWASEASPTLGCSIEISRDIYLCVCRGPKCARIITWPNTRMLKVS